MTLSPLWLLPQKGVGCEGPHLPRAPLGGHRQPPGPEVFFRDTRDQPAGLVAYPLHLAQSCDVYL